MKNKVSGNGKSTTFVVPFRWYVIERFSRCIAVLYIYKAGECSCERVYMSALIVAGKFLGNNRQRFNCKCNHL